MLIIKMVVDFLVKIKRNLREKLGILILRLDEIVDK